MTASATVTVALLDILRRAPLSVVQLFRVDEAAAMIGISEDGLQRSIRLGIRRGFVPLERGRYRSAWPQHGEDSTHLQAREITNAISERRGHQAARPELRDVGASSAPASGATAALDRNAATLFGHFAVFDQWAEINSPFEGHFMERMGAGAFARTMREDRAAMRVLLNHGRDPNIGMQPIAVITELREDSVGAYYEAELLDGLPPLVVSGLRERQYGASFRWKPVREEILESPGRSARNPLALPERTVTEAQVFEFGPVTFPAYSGATAGLRALAHTSNLASHRFTNKEEWLAWLTK